MPSNSKSPRCVVLCHAVCAVAEDIARDHPDLYRVWREVCSGV